MKNEGCDERIGTKAPHSSERMYLFIHAQFQAKVIQTSHIFVEFNRHYSNQFYEHESSSYSPWSRRRDECGEEADCQTHHHRKETCSAYSTNYEEA